MVVFIGVKPSKYTLKFVMAVSVYSCLMSIPNNSIHTTYNVHTVMPVESQPHLGTLVHFTLMATECRPLPLMHSCQIITA